MKKLPANLLFLFLISFSMGSHADSNAFPMVLESKDPEKPLEIIDDQTWVGAEMKSGRDSWGDLALRPFKTDSSKGPVTLVVDYAALRPDDTDGEAILNIGIECPEASDPCKIPINQSVMGIRASFMGESAVKIAGSPEAVWVARESHTYTFPNDTLVAIAITADEAPVHLQPVAIRARIIYGDYSRDALPGQETRMGLFGKIGIAVLLLLVIFAWYVRRQ